MLQEQVARIMESLRTPRADIDAVLSSMVKNGIIAGYRTSFYGSEHDEEATVTVLAPEGEGIDLKSLHERVHRALELIPVDIMVHVEAE